MENVPRRPPGRPKGTGSGYVRKTLRRRILTGELPPDTILDQPKLAKEFRVSRTPLREALIHLASEDYVELTTNRSPRVTPLPVTGLAPCYESLELSARILARWAAARGTDRHIEEMEMHNTACKAAFDAEDYLSFSEANDKFHTTISHAASNEYFARVYEQAHITSLRYANAIIFPDPFKKPWERAQYQSVLVEHAQMIEAIRVGDIAAAEQFTPQRWLSGRLTPSTTQRTCRS